VTRAKEGDASVRFIHHDAKRAAMVRTGACVPALAGGDLSAAAFPPPMECEGS
jgi:hypothetical protein